MRKEQKRDKWFEDLKKTYSKISESEFFSENEKIDCPVCQKTKFTEYHDICPKCGWQHDWMQLANPKVSNYANKLSLIDYRKWYKLTLEFQPNYFWKTEVKKEGQPSSESFKILKNKFKERKRKVANK